MNDGTVNIFINAKQYDKMNSSKLKAFCEYLCGQEPTSDFTDRLSVLVERLKLNAQRRHEFMTWEQEINIKVKEARAEKAIETAKNFLENGIAPDLIAKCTGLPLEQVLELQKAAATTTL